MIDMRTMLALPLAAALAAPAAAAGAHAGERGKIQARVSFLTPTGQTVTDGSGITYRAGSWSYHESKVYPSRYWGTFPLYFVGQTMTFSVTLSNTAAQGDKPFKVRVEALNHVLETSGGLGMQLAPPQEWLVQDLRPGQSQTRQFSIYIAPNPALPSGLDVTKVRILHLNEGANSDAGLIKEELAVWCPPALKDSPGR